MKNVSFGQTEIIFLLAKNTAGYNPVAPPGADTSPFFPKRSFLKFCLCLPTTMATTMMTTTTMTASTSKSAATQSQSAVVRLFLFRMSETQQMWKMASNGMSSYFIPCIDFFAIGRNTVGAPQQLNCNTCLALVLIYLLFHRLNLDLIRNTIQLDKMPRFYLKWHKQWGTKT